jgi:hypothetical protein
MKFLRLRLLTLVVLIVPAVAIGVWTAGPPPICVIHHFMMSRQTLPIAYGLIGLDGWCADYVKAKAEFFPNCDDHPIGGCEVGPETTRRMDVCTRCNAARDAWRQTNPRRTLNIPVYDPALPPFPLTN